MPFRSQSWSPWSIGPVWRPEVPSAASGVRSCSVPLADLRAPVVATLCGRRTPGNSPATPAGSHRASPLQRKTSSSRSAVEFRLGEIRRRFTQDLVRPSQLTYLALQILDPRAVVAGDSVPTTGVHLSSTYPLAQRLGPTADLGRDRAHRLPLRVVLAPLVQYQPNCPLAHLWGIPASSCHDSILSRNEVSSKLRAIQRTCVP